MWMVSHTFGSRLALMPGIRMTALFAGEDISPGMTVHPRRIKSGVDWTFQESSLRLKRLPTELSARSMAYLVCSNIRIPLPNRKSNVQNMAWLQRKAAFPTHMDARRAKNADKNSREPWFCRAHGVFISYPAKVPFLSSPPAVEIRRTQHILTKILFYAIPLYYTQFSHEHAAMLPANPYAETIFVKSATSRITASTLRRSARRFSLIISSLSMTMTLSKKASIGATSSMRASIAPSKYSPLPRLSTALFVDVYAC